MLLLLPPSESKRPGGDLDRPLDLRALSRPELAAPRRTALARLRELSRDLAAAAQALGLGSRSAAEAAINREVRSGPTMPAIERFDGVLYDALDAGSLDAAARGWLAGHVAIASALFGLVSASDRIPAYRLSAAARLPGTTLARIWREPLGRSLHRTAGAVIDLRSEAYAALGPAATPAVRIVDRAGGRSLSHANKAAKGRLVRMLAEHRPEVADPAGFADWARSVGLGAEVARDGRLALAVDP